MNIVCIVQTRMGSTRLPGKVMKEVLGKPLLEYQIERLKRSKLINNIVVATTLEERDDVLEDFSDGLKIDCYRGSENDVLNRYYEAAKQFKADIIVRVTSDCPLIDPDVLDEVISFYLDNEYDYVSNVFKRAYPRGLDVELFSMNALESAEKNSTSAAEREHVTYQIYSNEDKYKIGHAEKKFDYSQHRWTVDTDDDFLLIKNIIEYLYPQNKNFRMQDVLDTLNLFPEWFYINNHIEQKKV